MAARLSKHYPVLFRGKNGTCAHEFILDFRPIKESSGVEVEVSSRGGFKRGGPSPVLCITRIEDNLDVTLGLCLFLGRTLLSVS
jgi:hypothetical protein